MELELDRAQELRRKAESEGEKMATEAYEKHRAQYDESAKIKVLRDLTRLHIEAGKTDEEIIAWIGVEQVFIENIRVVVQRVQKFRAENQAKRVILPGRPVGFRITGAAARCILRARRLKFELWWEMGVHALIIVDAPTPDMWEDKTGLPPERRAEVLNFIGEEIVATQTISGGSFIVGENVLAIYSD